MKLEADEMFLGCVCSGSYAFVLTTTSDVLAIASVFRSPQGLPPPGPPREAR